MAYRTRDLPVRQRTQTINALQADLAEHSIVVPVGPAHVGRLAAVVDGDDGVLPAAVSILRSSDQRPRIRQTILSYRAGRPADQRPTVPVELFP